MNKYKFGHKKVPKKRVVFFALLGCLVVIGLVGYLIARDVKTTGDAAVEGESRVIGQVVGETSARLTIDEPTFTMQLPGDWKEVIRDKAGNSITWQSTKKGQDARSLVIYIDKLPLTMAVNRLMPVTVNGASMTPGAVSDNCASFTGGGENKDDLTPDAPARWAGVDFICTLHGVDNQVGVGTTGAINQVELKGEQEGSHKYFFLYIERNIQPNYSILSDALESFKAK